MFGEENPEFAPMENKTTMGTQYFSGTQSSRTNIKVLYLTSFAHSASETLLHVYKTDGPNAVSASNRRVIIISDEEGYSKPFASSVQQCLDFSAVEELSLSGAGGFSDGASKLASGATSQTDIDKLHTRCAPLDFIRLIGAVYRPPRKVGDENAPPLLEMDEGQVFLGGGTVLQCRYRSKPLRQAVVGGVSTEAVKLLSEEHRKQLAAVSSSQTGTAQEIRELYLERENMKQELAQSKRDLAAYNASSAEAELKEELRRSYDENKRLRLLTQNHSNTTSTRDINTSSTTVGGQKAILAFSPAGASGVGSKQSLAALGGEVGYSGTTDRSVNMSSTTVNNSYSAPNLAYMTSSSEALARLHNDIQDGESFLASLRQ